MPGLWRSRGYAHAGLTWSDRERIRKAKQAASWERMKAQAAQRVSK